MMTCAWTIEDSDGDKLEITQDGEHLNFRAVDGARSFTVFVNEEDQMSLFRLLAEQLGYEVLEDD